MNGKGFPLVYIFMLFFSAITTILHLRQLRKFDDGPVVEKTG